MAQKFKNNWEEIIREQRESGTSIKAFCLTKGIHQNTFYINRKKLGKSGFVKISPKKQTTASGAITIKYRELSIIVEPDSSRDTLQNLLSLLGIIQ